VEAGFEYRDITGLDASERSGPWLQTKWAHLNAAGAFSAEVVGLKAGNVYEFRAAVKNSTSTIYGHEIDFNAKQTN